MVTNENRAAQSSAASTAVPTTAAVAALGHGVADDKVLDRGGDRFRRIADEKDTELIIAADCEVRRAAAIDHRMVAEDQRQLV
jgi:hypothetical protein